MKKLTGILMMSIVMLTASCSSQNKEEKQVIESLKSLMHDPDSFELEELLKVQEYTYEDLYTLESNYNDVDLLQAVVDTLQYNYDTEGEYLKEVNGSLLAIGKRALEQEQDNLKKINTLKDSLQTANKLDQPALKVFNIKYRGKNALGGKILSHSLVITNSENVVVDAVESDEELDILSNSPFLEEVDREMYSFYKED